MTTIPCGNHDQKVIVIVHVLIEITCLGGVEIQITPPGGTMDVGTITTSLAVFTTTNCEQLEVERQGQGSVAVANIAKGNLCTGSDAIGHAGAVESFPGDGPGDVRAVSVFVVAGVHEIFVLGNFAGCCIDETL